MKFIKFANQFVTVELDNGQMLIGTLTVLDAETITVRTGVAGRNAVVWVGDVNEVLPVDRANPHVEVA